MSLILILMLIYLCFAPLVLQSVEKTMCYVSTLLKQNYVLNKFSASYFVAVLLIMNN